MVIERAAVAGFQERLLEHHFDSGGQIVSHIGTGQLRPTACPVAEAATIAEQLLIAISQLNLPIAGAGILTAVDGELSLTACSNEQVRQLELIQLERDEGPCLLAFRSGQPVMVEDLVATEQCWPAFARQAAEFHYLSVCALPIQWGSDRVGALNFFRKEVGAMPISQVAAGQALADIAAVGILQQRRLNRSEIVNRQLQTALDSRIVIEQAKGILAERGSIDMLEAFTLLRSYARSSRQRLTDLAHAVVCGADTSALLNPVCHPRSSPSRSVELETAGRR